MPDNPVSFIVVYRINNSLFVNIYLQLTAVSPGTENSCSDCAGAGDNLELFDQYICTGSHNTHFLKPSVLLRRSKTGNEKKSDFALPLWKIFWKC